jgi:hypothetical protein
LTPTYSAATNALRAFLLLAGAWRTKAIATELKLWNWSTGKRPTGDDELDCEEKTR